MIDEHSLAGRLAVDLDAHFEDLVRTFQDRLYGFALRLTGSPQDAEESVQDTFVRALPQPVQLALTAALTEALSATSIDGIVAAIGQLRTILESEGAAANDVVVNLKARRPAPIQAASETATLPDTS